MQMGMDVPRAAMYLLTLDLKGRSVFVQPYSKRQLPEANKDYLEVEKETQNNPQVLAVLVSVDSVKALKAAYPNYYLDSNTFIDALTKAIE